MNQGSTPGDGKTSPYGDGRGGSAGGSMSGNNFATNPRGNPSGPSKLPDLINNSRPQQAAKSDINTQDAAPGGLLPAAMPPPTRPGGVGSLGNSQKPFKLGG